LQEALPSDEISSNLKEVLPSDEISVSINGSRCNDVMSSNLSVSTAADMAILDKSGSDLKIPTSSFLAHAHIRAYKTAASVYTSMSDSTIGSLHQESFPTQGPSGCRAEYHVSHDDDLRQDLQRAQQEIDGLRYEFQVTIKSVFFLLFPATDAGIMCVFMGGSV